MRFRSLFRHGDSGGRVGQPRARLAFGGMYNGGHHALSIPEARRMEDFQTLLPDVNVVLV
jgi:hypothetical protein